MVDTPVQRETYTSEESSQDDHSSVGVGSSMEHRVDVTIPTPRLQRSISSHSAKKDSRTARARSPKSGTSANSDPGSQGHNDPKPARRSPVAPVVKSVPQVLKIAAKPPITLKPVEQQIVNPPRRLHAHMKPHVPAPHAAVPPRRPLGSGPHRDQAPKRRSVAPASAGEYFAHILREYPDVSDARNDSVSLSSNCLPPYC